MDVGPIPWSAVVDYAERAGLDDEAADTFVFLIRELELAFRRWTREEAALLRSLQKREDERPKAE